jgi:hypothetical protein
MKPPDFLADVYYDLRDRRLLPFVALVVVATVAAPFLLGGGAEQPALPPAVGGASAAVAGEGSAAKLTVVEATPGLRSYRKRLRDRTPTDPFEQRFTEPAGGATSSSAGGDAASSSSGSNAFSEGSVTTEGSATPVEGGSGGGSGSSGGGGSSGGSGNGGGSGSGGATPHLLLFDYAIDVRITHSDGAGGGDQPQGQPESSVKHRVLPQTPLPGEKAPVVTYLGPGRKEGNKATGRILLLVSGDVSSVSGQSSCVSRGSGDVCQLLEVEPGFPLNLVYGANQTSYTIEVLDIKLVVTGHT